MNYFSSWIANLGVVPLFWFWAFLLLPIFTFLLARRLRVTLVLETIIFSLTYQRFRQKNLTNLTNYVKTIIILLITTHSNLRYSYSTPEENIYIGKGQVFKIKEKSINHFTVGNKEVIKVKALKNGSLLVKGNKIGHSELLVWKMSKQRPKKYTFNIISKAAQTKQIRIKETLTQLGLKYSFNSKKFQVSGLLDSITNYQNLKSAYQQYKVNLNIKNVSLSNELKKKILIEVYDISLNNKIDQLDCNFRSLYLICQYDVSNSLPKEIVSLLKEYFFLRLIPVHIHKHRFFNAKLNIIQFENHEGEDFNLGLDKIESAPLQLFSNNLSSLIKNNHIFINQKNIDVSTIAKPESTIRFNHPAKIKIGSEIPYSSTQTTGHTNTQWKFAGLELNIKIEPSGDHILTVYETKFTRPSERNTISGSHESSSGYLIPGKPLKLFDITYQSHGKEESKLPYLSSIPILGKLFVSSRDQSSYKKIVGYLLLEEISL